MVDRLCEGSGGPQVRSAKGTGPALRWWHSDNPRLCSLCGHVDVGRCNYPDLAWRSLRCLVCALARPLTSTLGLGRGVGNAVWLRCVEGCAAMAAPRHVPSVACAPNRRHRPAPVVVVVAVGAACRWYDDPAAIGGYEVADVVVGELVARIGHCDVVPRTTDNECPQIRQGFRDR